LECEAIKAVRRKGFYIYGITDLLFTDLKRGLVDLRCSTNTDVFGNGESGFLMFKSFLKITTVTQVMIAGIEG